MPRVQPVAIDNAPPEAREVFARFQAERGNVPNMFRTLALRPEVMTAFDAALRAVLHTGALPLRLKEMVAVRVSQLNGCRY
ncbi:MAG: carboxymuconolactone decarboxylase family protein [Chloroflexota bacterium]|nr:carboxymuconolactone decarboxylase family protein [Chloroflexota bacterium]